MSNSQHIQLSQRSATSNNTFPASLQDIQLGPQHQYMSDMNRFDIHQLYSNTQIAAQNKYRSGFVFILPIINQGGRHLIAIEKKHIIWIIVKMIALTTLCYELYQWVEGISTLSQLVKTLFLWSFKLLPPLLFFVMLIDPGFVLDHQIYENEYEQTDDKRRPKDGKYCENCKLFVRRKTGHCVSCNHCVSNFDHHCGIMGRCVGRTNAVLFYTFVILANVVYMGMILLAFQKFVIV